MQEPSHAPVEVRKVRRAKRSRKGLLKGTAIVLLLIFGVTTVQRYFGSEGVVWLAGAIGVWLLISSYTRRRPERPSLEFGGGRVECLRVAVAARPHALDDRVKAIAVPLGVR